MSKGRSKKRRTKSRARVFKERDEALRALGFRSYGEYIASPLWAARRRAFFETHEKRCAVCDAEHGPIFLHHCTYERVACELDRDLVPLCHRCHGLVHTISGDFSWRWVRLMRAVFEERGDPALAFRERSTNREDRLNRHSQRVAGGRRVPHSPVRVLMASDLTAEQRERYALKSR